MMRDFAERLAIALVCLVAVLGLMAEIESRDEQTFTLEQQP